LLIGVLVDKVTYSYGELKTGPLRLAITYLNIIQSIINWRLV
jgi:hypothetical protein